MGLLRSSRSGGRGRHGRIVVRGVGAQGWSFDAIRGCGRRRVTLGMWWDVFIVPRRELAARPPWNAVPVRYRRSWTLALSWSTRAGLHAAATSSSTSQSESVETVVGRLDAPVRYYIASIIILYGVLVADRGPPSTCCPGGDRDGAGRSGLAAAVGISMANSPVGGHLAPMVTVVATNCLGYRMCRGGIAKSFRYGVRARLLGGGRVGVESLQQHAFCYNLIRRRASSCGG